MTIQRIGAWVGRAALSKPTKYVYRAADLGLTDVSLFVTSLSDQHFELIRPARYVRRAVRSFQSAGLSVHLSTWVRPQRRYLTALADQLVPLCGKLGIATLDLDAESAWRGTGRRHNTAASLLFDALSNRGLTIPVGVNDYASLQGCTRCLLDRADIMRPQLYSVEYVTHGKRGPDGRRWTTPKSVYWPGRTQRWGMDPKRWNSYLGARRLEVGLAAYKQSWRRVPMSTEDAMTTCFDTAAELGAEAVWYWSLEAMTGEVARVIGALSNRVAIAQSETKSLASIATWCGDHIDNGGAE